jgi:hypothetical protein
MKLLNKHPGCDSKEKHGGEKTREGVKICFVVYYEWMKRELNLYTNVGVMKD